MYHLLGKQLYVASTETTLVFDTLCTTVQGKLSWLFEIAV